MGPPTGPEEVEEPFSRAESGHGAIWQGRKWLGTLQNGRKWSGALR